MFGHEGRPFGLSDRIRITGLKFVERRFGSSFGTRDVYVLVGSRMWSVSYLRLLSMEGPQVTPVVSGSTVTSESRSEFKEEGLYTSSTGSHPTSRRRLWRGGPGGRSFPPDLLVVLLLVSTLSRDRSLRGGRDGCVRGGREGAPRRRLWAGLGG